MGAGKIFSRERPPLDFYKIFTRGRSKVVKFDFSYSKLENNLLCSLDCYASFVCWPSVVVS